ncbi:hypothetical protein Cgig2_000527 [Carnegiea gigantea]|uniref:Uncharacterized protein n=1 Tax=Carnegiea gigantea TaxID=171969 RepID=A0A9Q1JM28_9CARY|nr:hypothetical protein Cgig2_000527 [Carnegiea gigantea]
MEIKGLHMLKKAQPTGMPHKPHNAAKCYESREQSDHTTMECRALKKVVVPTAYDVAIGRPNPSKVQAALILALKVAPVRIVPLKLHDVDHIGITFLNGLLITKNHLFWVLDSPLSLLTILAVSDPSLKIFTLAVEVLRAHLKELSKDNQPLLCALDIPLTFGTLDIF